MSETDRRASASSEPAKTPPVCSRCKRPLERGTFGQTGCRPCAQELGQVCRLCRAPRFDCAC